MRRNRLCQQCNEKITVIRRIKRGLSKGRLRIFSDDRHTLCGRCFDSLWQSVQQETWNNKDE